MRKQSKSLLSMILTAAMVVSLGAGVTGEKSKAADATKIAPEFTVTSIIMGVILAVIFGAANAYLGLRVGMTVSASIPAAVISMGVIRKIMKKNSILDKCAIPLLRLRTDGSGEKEKIRNALKRE